MRAFAAVVILAACSLRSRASANPRDVTDTPVHRIAKCTSTIGLSKCLGALAAYRAEKAVATIKDRRVDSLAKDVENFPWEHFANSSDEDMYSQLCDGTEKLLQYRSMKLNIVPGYELKLLSSGNGTLNIDVFKSDPNTERGMKKWRNQFYNMVPFLLLPGLIMSAILPFVLPAMKMMTVAVGMLNNMALSGAIFTLLRNNAFNDKYDKKVVYVNEGYHNEKHANTHHSLHHKPDNIDFGVHQSPAGDFHENQYTGFHGVGEDFEIIEESPTENEDWIKEYYGNKLIKVARDDYRRENDYRREKGG